MRTFQLLSDLPRTFITQCQQMLPNQCQCPKPGFVLVTETIDVPVEEAKAVAGTDKEIKSATKTTQYQLCRGHASLLKQQDDAEKAAAGEPVPTPIATPLQLKKDALDKEAVQAQTTMPQGENSPNNAPVTPTKK